MNLIDYVYVIIIAGIYNIFSYKLIEIIFKDVQYKEKIQGTLTSMFFAGIIAIIIAELAIKKGKKFSNEPLHKGLILGGCLLMCYTLLVNWRIMSDETKLLLIGFIFGATIWYGYYYNQEESQPVIKKVKLPKLEKLTDQEVKL